MDEEKIWTWQGCPECKSILKITEEIGMGLAEGKRLFICEKCSRFGPARYYTAEFLMDYWRGKS